MKFYLFVYLEKKEKNVMSKQEKGLICFWLWVAIILVSFMMFVVSFVANAMPKIAVAVFAAVVFGLSISVPIINPGIFAKQNTTATSI